MSPDIPVEHIDPVIFGAGWVDLVEGSFVRIAFGEVWTYNLHIALIKWYVGQGPRQDLAKLFADRVLEKTAQVLTRHIQSEEEVSAILKEIRVEAV